VEAPQDVLIGLRNVRDTFDLRWNPTAKVVGGHSFDVNGNPRELQHEGRWELWDTDAHGNEYKVMTLQNEGEFVPPGTWLVELIRLMDPARYGGDIHKAIEAMVDEPNDYVSNIGQQEYIDLVDSLVDRFFVATTPRSNVIKNISPAV
jgi:hypothetical protein